MDTIIQTGETCGIEFESDDQFSDNFRVPGFRGTHDASIETPVTISENFVLSPESSPDALSLLQTKKNSTMGLELVSSILDSNSEQTIDLIKRLCGNLSERGETEISERSGIHYHFSLPNPSLKTLKSLLRIGRNLESVLFTLGGMGYEFRGVKNDSTYCRPITKFGPPCIKYGSNWAQVFDLKNLLKSSSVNDFIIRYGDLSNHVGRYNPVRYCWLNLYPLFPFGDQKNTVEFRIFNKTLNPMFIYATLIFCKSIVGFALKSAYSDLKENDLLEENSIYNDYTKQEVINQFLKFSSLVNLSGEIVDILLTILERSPVPILNKDFVKTHLRNELSRYWNYTIDFEPIIVKNPKNPLYVDIHTLRGDR